MYAYTPTMTPYLANLGISFSMIGLIGGAYGLSQMILRIPIGILSDKIGKRKLFVILGLIAATISATGMFFTQNAYVILFLRFLAGVSASAWVVMSVLFSGYFDKSKLASRMAYLFMVLGIGQMTSRLVGGFVAERFGHEYTFLLGGGAALTAVLLGLFITEKAPDVKELPSVKTLFGVIKNKNLFAMSVLAIFSQMIMHSTITTFLPEAASQIGADLMQLGLLATIATIPSIVSSFICGRLFSVKSVDVRIVIAVGFVFQVAGTLVIPFTDSMAAVFVAAVAIGFGCGICMSTFLGYCTQTVDESRRSAAMGFFQAIYAFGMFMGPVVIGVFVDWRGISGGFFMASAFAMTGFILTFVLLRNREKSLE